MSYITPRRNLRFDKFAVINGDTALRGSEHFHPWPLNGATVNAGLPLGEAGFRNRRAGLRYP